VGYDWVGRYREAQHDVRVAEERSRRPLTSPSKVSDELEDRIVAARKQHPTWGPKKLRTLIANNNPQVEIPAPSTIGSILSRRGMPQRKLRKRRSTKAERLHSQRSRGPTPRGASTSRVTSWSATAAGIR
jgi:hypothetical protein